MDELDDLRRRLSAFCRAVLGAGAEVHSLEPMPGHAGFSYGFTVRGPAGDAEREQSLVLRLAPPGARARGTADVARHARLVAGLEGTSVPVPEVIWLGDDPRWFGRPYSIVRRLPGRTSFALGSGADDAAAAIAPQAAAALAALHRLDWRKLAPDWGPPLDLRADVERWDSLWKRAADPELVRLAPEVKRWLLECAPSRVRTGLFHGDFQWGNFLHEDGRLVAILDWELSGVGAVLNDLGWLLVFSDPASWADGLLAAGVPAPEKLVELYAHAGGELRDVEWFRALAGYKFALIGGFNLALHRRGKRVDPFWETLAPSLPRLLERARELVELSGR